MKLQNYGFVKKLAITFFIFFVGKEKKPRNRNPEALRGNETVILFFHKLQGADRFFRLHSDEIYAMG